MTEEPYRWLEAIENRKEYVLEELKTAAPVIAVSVEKGILLLGVGHGQSKVFEVYDRQGLAALGHGADIDSIRQALIDAAHLEGFTRSSADVTLKRLIGLSLSRQLKTQFEQLFSPPYLIELIAAELGETLEEDQLIRLKHDGETQVKSRLVLATGKGSDETNFERRFLGSFSRELNIADAVKKMLLVWAVAASGDHAETLSEALEEPESRWKDVLGDRVVEIGFLERQSQKRARYQSMDLEALGL